MTETYPIQERVEAALGAERADKLLTGLDNYSNQPNAVKGAAKRPSDPEVEAVEDAKIDFGQVDSTRAGCLVGSGIGGILAILEWHRIILEKGPGHISPFFIPSLIVNMASGQLSIRRA